MVLRRLPFDDIRAARSGPVMSTIPSGERTEAALPVQADDEHAERIRVEGLVQGVGFRFHVRQLARQYGMRGWVANIARDVVLHACGPAAQWEAFVRAIADEAPSPARVDRIERTPAEPLPRDAGFVIK